MAMTVVVGGTVGQAGPMDVVVVGGHGKIGLRLARLLTGAGHTVRSVVRNPDHAPDVEAAGGRPALVDIEGPDAVAGLTEAAEGADAVVFAAGAGPGSGAERKQTVDLGGAVALIAAARTVGIDRYVMVSSIGADRPEEGRGPMRAYLQAKADADAALRASDLAWTVVRPVSLTDEPGTGRVTVAEHLDHRGTVPRDDVAAVLAALLVDGSAVGRVLEVASGDAAVADALAPFT